MLASTSTAMLASASTAMLAKPVGRTYIKVLREVDVSNQKQQGVAF